MLHLISVFIPHNLFKEKKKLIHSGAQELGDFLASGGILLAPDKDPVFFKKEMLMLSHIMSVLFNLEKQIKKSPSPIPRGSKKHFLRKQLNKHTDRHVHWSVSCVFFTITF